MFAKDRCATVIVLFSEVDHIYLTPPCYDLVLHRFG